MRKRGDLINNVLGLIIAVIGIGLILFAAVKFYSAMVKQEGENAKQFMNALEGKVSLLKDGGTGSYPMRGIRGWYFVGWNKDEIGRPDKCFFQSCYCLCPKPEEGKSIADVCQSRGICKLTDVPVVEVLEFQMVENAKNFVRAEDALRDVQRYKQKGKWSDLADEYVLLQEPFFFSDDTLHEIMVYKDTQRLHLFKINEIDFGSNIPYFVPGVIFGFTVKDRGLSLNSQRQIEEKLKLLTIVRGQDEKTR